MVTINTNAATAITPAITAVSAPTTNISNSVVATVLREIIVELS